MDFISSFSEMSNLPTGSFRRTIKGKALADFIYIAPLASDSAAAATSSSSVSQKKSVYFMNAFYPSPRSPDMRPRKHRFSKEGAEEADAAFPSNSFDLYFILCVPDFFSRCIECPAKPLGLGNAVFDRFSLYEMSIPLIGSRERLPRASHSQAQKRKRQQTS